MSNIEFIISKYNSTKNFYNDNNNNFKNNLIDIDDLKQIFIFIRNEKELSSQIYKCLEIIQNNLIYTNLENLEKIKNILYDGFINIVQNTISSNLRDYTMNWLMGIFFKININTNIFISIYFETLELKTILFNNSNNYPKNFYFNYKKMDKNLFDKISFIYNSIDKKYCKDIKMQLVCQKIYNFCGLNFIYFLLILMCEKIKINSNKFDIEKEKNLFKIFFQTICNKNYFHLYIDICEYAFNENENIQNKKIFLFCCFILLNDISKENFNNFLIKYINEPKQLIDLFFQYKDFRILNESIFHLYPSLETSKNFIYCFENILSNFFIKENLINENIINNFDLSINFIEFFEKIYNLNKSLLFKQLYYNLQILLIKNLNLYSDKEKKINLNKIFDKSKNFFEFQKNLKNYEKEYSNNINFIKKFVLFKNNDIFINWINILIKHFSIFDCYLMLKLYLFKNLNDKEIKLYFIEEFNKLYPGYFKRILLFLIYENEINQFNNQQILNFIQNLKTIYYYFNKKSDNINLNNNMFNSLNLNYEIIDFLKENFNKISSYFFGRENNSMINKMDIDEKFELTVFNKASNHKIIFNNKDMNNKNFEKNDIILNNIKFEILEFYSIIITLFKSDENINEIFIEFIKNLIDLNVKINLYINNNNKYLLNYIEQLIAYLIKLYIKKKNEKYNLNHPLLIIFDQIILYLLLKIVENEKNEYFHLFLKIFIIVNKQNNNFLLITLQNKIIYIIKQLIYKNCDSQNFRNPNELKLMNNLNDIDGNITNHKYILDLLELLNEKQQENFYGFYIKFLKANSSKIFFNKENMIKLINLLIKIKLIPKYIKQIKIIIIKDEISFNKKQQIINLLIELCENHFKKNIINNDEQNYKIKNYNNINNNHDAILKIKFQSLIIDNISELI